MLSVLREKVYQSNMVLFENNLVVMTSGNVSGRDPESGFIVIKPSGVPYNTLTPDNMVIVNINGEIIEGNLNPSIDTETHLYIYKNREDVFGVCHTHSPYATSFAVLGKPIPACLTASAMIGGEVPVSKFAYIGGKAIGKEIITSIGNMRAVLLQNHGVFTIGDSPSHAVKMAVEVEEIAKITHLALIKGNPIILSKDQIVNLEIMYEKEYGQN